MGKNKCIPYSEKLLKEKTFAVVPPVDAASPNFAQKVLRIATKLQKFAKVFSVENFPLYESNCCHKLF